MKRKNVFCDCIFRCHNCHRLQGTLNTDEIKGDYFVESCVHMRRAFERFQNTDDTFREWIYKCRRFVLYIHEDNE